MYGRGGLFSLLVDSGPVSIVLSVMLLGPVSIPSFEERVERGGRLGHEIPTYTWTGCCILRGEVMGVILLLPCWVSTLVS